MSKVTIRVEMHRNHPDKFMRLIEKLITRHEELGASSPLSGNPVVDMAAFKQKFTEANSFREQSIEARALAEATMGQAKAIMGTASGQSVNTEHTLLYELNLLKKYLLIKYSGEEESMSPFGFNVVIGTAKGVGRPKKKKS